MTKILLDFDHPDKPDFFRIYTVCRLLFLKVRTVKITKSTHNGTHVTITVERTLEKFDIVCIQALCGSDYKRECFNYLRAEAMNRRFPGSYWENNWNVLFEADQSPKRDTLQSKPIKKRGAAIKWKVGS